MKSLATWCVRHRRRSSLLLWLAALVGMTLLSGVGGHRLLQQLHPAQHRVDPGPRPAPGGGSRAWPATGSRSSSTPPTAPRSPTRRSRPPSTTMLAKVARLPHVTDIVSPYDPLGAAPDQRRRDHRLRHRHLRPAGPEHLDPGGQAVRVHRPDRRRSRPAGGGVRPGGRGGRQAVLRRHRARACILAAIVLLLVFGSVFAMVLPLLSALASLGTAIGVIGLLSHVLKMPRVLDRAGPADRPRRGRRLRPVHRDPTPTGPHRRQRRRVVHRQRRQHLGPGRPVRRDHRLHRPARHVRPRRLLPLRTGHRRRHRRAVHHDRRPHPAARLPRLHRAPGAEPASRRGTWPPTGPGSSAPAPRASGPGGRRSSSGARSSRPWSP